MRVEDTNAWLKRTALEKKAQRDRGEGFEGAGDTWRLLIKLLRHI